MIKSIIHYLILKETNELIRLLSADFKQFSHSVTSYLMILNRLVHLGCRFVHHLFPVDDFDHGFHFGQIFKERQTHLNECLVLFQSELHPLLEKGNISQHL